MALSDAYASAADYITRVRPDSRDNDDSTLDEDLLAVSRYLDGKLGRCFNRADEAEDRIYVVKNNGQYIDIDDFADVPLLVQLDQDRDGIYEITLSGNDFEMLPRNAQLLADPRPYDRLALLWWSHRSFLNETRIKINGYPGWPSTPIAVKVATIQLTALLRLETARATRKIPEGMDTALETSLDAQRILRDLTASYARMYGFV